MHGEPTHLEEWAALLGDDVPDEALDREDEGFDDGERVVPDDAA